MKTYRVEVTYRDVRTEIVEVEAICDSDAYDKAETLIVDGQPSGVSRNVYESRIIGRKA